MTLELPPTIPETLTGHPPRDNKDAYYQAQLGDEEISLVLLKIPKDTTGKPAVIATASEKIVYENSSAKVVSTVTKLKNQILDRVAMAAEVCQALPDLEVRLVDRGGSW